MSDSQSPSERPRPTPRSARAPGHEPVRWWVRYGVVFVFAVLIVNAIAGERGYFEMRRLEQRHVEAAAALAARRAENEALRTAIHRLRSDATAVETAVRDQLGYARPGEVVFTIRDAPQRPTAQPAVPSATKPTPAR